jgi:hypothetical protein
MDNQLAVFEQKPIRNVEHNGETYFSVVDIIETLTDSPKPRNYWSDLKRRENQLHEVCVQLKLPSSDGKKYATDCANTEGFCCTFKDFNSNGFVRIKKEERKRLLLIINILCF